MATKPTRAPTAHIVPFGLRLQPDLKARLEEAATKAGRSLNAEIAERLEKSFHSHMGEKEFSHFEQTLLNTVKHLGEAQQKRIDQLEAALKEVRAQVTIEGAPPPSGKIKPGKK